eukprot:31637_1
MISRHICNEAGTHYAQDLATHLLILKNRTEPKYHLYYGSKVIDAAFYATTNLLVSESIELTPQTNPIGNRIRIIATANIDNLPVPNNRQNQDDAKANDEAPRELQPQSTKQRLQLEYPCLMTFISHYPVRQIRELHDCIVFDLDKSPRDAEFYAVCGLFWEDDRTCLKLKRLISNEFQHCLQTKLRMQHEGGVINEATYKKATSYEL